VSAQPGNADWSVVDNSTDPTLSVQLAAEQIARAEHAKVYQQRRERMDGAIRQIEAAAGARPRLPDAGQQHFHTQHGSLIIRLT
jgi:hypothetical protein